MDLQQLFKYNTENYSSSSPSFVSLGQAYEIKSDKQKAIDAFMRAYKLNSGLPESVEGWLVWGSRLGWNNALLEIFAAFMQ